MTETKGDLGKLYNDQVSKGRIWQVIGASSRDGGEIAERPVTPGDLAATIYHHMGVPLNATYDDHQGRPMFIVDEGKPIGELI